MNVQICLVASVLLATCIVGTAHAEDNHMIIVVANGPFAGTYKPDATSVVCIQAKAQDVFSSGWSDFATTDSAIAEAGLEVNHAAGGGSKTGSAHVAFGKDKKQTVYDVAGAPIALQRTAKGGVITFDGATKSGIKLHIEAVCTDVQSL